MVGKTSALKQYQFTVDMTPPANFEIEPVISPTNNSKQTIKGSKEAWASVLLNGNKIINNTADTVWQHTVNLSNGVNQFIFVSQDRAKNLSDELITVIIYDDIAPPAVETLIADGKGDGHSIKLDWTGYDEDLHGDVTSYRIYAEDSFFTQVSPLEIKGSVQSGTWKYVVSELEKDKNYYLAVVAVDKNNNALNSVTPILVSLTDIIPPPDATNLIAHSFDDKLIFQWDHSLNIDNDLAGYNVYLKAGSENYSLTPGQNQYEIKDLEPATGYGFHLTAFDKENNESQGIAITGVTLLDNPTNINITPHSGYVDITWDNSKPEAFVKKYNIYVSDSDFSNVSDLTPKREINKNSTKIAGLVNDKTYYFAVTTVNISDGEKQTITSIESTPIPDRIGPEITKITLDNVDIANDVTIQKLSQIKVQANDPAGIGRIEWFINDELFEMNTTGSTITTWNIDPYHIDDGDYQLIIKVFDTLGNFTVQNYNIKIALLPPVSPEISSPVNNYLTNKTQITLSGIAEKNSSVIPLINNEQIGPWKPVDRSGLFSFSVPLDEGENQIYMLAKNRSGNSNASKSILITRDTTIPYPPKNIQAVSKQNGVIRISWAQPDKASVKEYKIYSSSQPFTKADGADLIKSNYSLTAFDDRPETDGIYYYRVSLINIVGNESDLSDLVFAKSDSMEPKALLIKYTPKGHFDETSKSMGPGMVNVDLTLNEPLLFSPFLSINPAGAIPMTVKLNKESDTSYSGFFIISGNTPTGIARAVFSCRDLAGNRGSYIEEGDEIKIDTSGPDVTFIEIQPGSPIRNFEDAQVPVRVTLGLDEFSDPDSTIALSYQLSGENREIIPINNLKRIGSSRDQGENWRGLFQLPSDAGLNELESFQLFYKGLDKLQNESDRILCNNQFFVYQGELPPLETPSGLSAKSLSGGKIKLRWEPVTDAAGYQIYKKSSLDTELQEYIIVNDTTEFIDNTNSDDQYDYAISSIRKWNEQESISPHSNIVSIRSDSTPPETPQNLILELIPEGIKASWNPNTDPDFYMYHLYRAQGNEILSTDDLVPIKTHFKGTLIIDYHPSPTEHCYVLTALDQIGNESTPSNSAYLNPGLLPPSSIIIEKQEDSFPVITWDHAAKHAVSGYYLSINDSQVQDSLITSYEYNDEGYDGKFRTYSLIAVDENQKGSLKRSASLPVMYLERDENESLNRGVINRLYYDVTNISNTSIDNIRLKIMLKNIMHQSESFAIDPETTRRISIAVGGYQNLNVIEQVQEILEITPNPGTQTRLIQTSEIEIGQSMMILGIYNDEFIRGNMGSFYFTLENTGDETIEILTAHGNSSSQEIIIRLLDDEENILTQQNYLQKYGSNIHSLTDTRTFASINANQLFTSQPIDLNVPVHSPDNVILEVSIHNIYFQPGKPEQVKMEGLTSRRSLTLKDTSYYGKVLNISPVKSSGENITITGHAIDRSTQELLPDVPLKLVISVRGFERSYQVTTNESGFFNYVFKPLPSESGSYKVWAIHPDLLDKPVQGEFTISRVNVQSITLKTPETGIQKPVSYEHIMKVISIDPTTINLSVPKNYEQSLSIQFTAGEEPIENLRLVYDAVDQPEGVTHTGVHIHLGAPVESLMPGQSTTLSWKINAGHNAPQEAKIVLKIKSNDSEVSDHGSVVMNAHFSEAYPLMYCFPTSIETGVVHDTFTSESITIENRGLSTLNNVYISLRDDKGKSISSRAWISLNSESYLKHLVVGEQRSVEFSVHPSSDVQVKPDPYLFHIHIESSNHNTVNIPIYVYVKRSGIGGVLFKVSDIYTGTVDPVTQDLVEGLSGARVRIQNEEDNSEYVLTTDKYGEAWFENLRSGRYKCKVIASNHQEHTGRFWIKPGITMDYPVMLKSNLVTVEWSVKEITIEDKYEIILSATYETNVPAAVVVAEPQSINLPYMEPGDVYNGEFTLTNYGLIRASELDINIPESNESFQYEILSSPPPFLEPKEQISIPYRVTRLRENDNSRKRYYPDQSECNIYWVRISTTYLFQCANGTKYIESSNHTLYLKDKCDFPDAEEFIEDYVIPETKQTIFKKVVSSIIKPFVPNIPKSTVSTVTVSGPQPQYIPASKTRHEQQSIEGTKCWPIREWMDVVCDPRLKNLQGDSLPQVDTGCTVNCFLKEYHDESKDMSAHVPGGNIDIIRLYYNKRWHWPVLNNNLEFEWDLLHQYIQTIHRAQVKYMIYGNDRRIYKSDQFQIIVEKDGYQWKDTLGNYELYDLNGYLISYGNISSGLIAKLKYTDDSLHQLSGMFNRNDEQVIWFEYDDNGRLKNITDAIGRKVLYEYTDDSLSKVIDIFNRETIYKTDSEGKIVESIDAENRNTFAKYDSYGNIQSVLDSNGVGHFFEFDYDETKRESYASIQTNSGRIKEVWFDSKGRTKKLSINGRVIKEVSFDGRDRIVTDEKNNKTYMFYDEWGNLIRVIYPDDSEISMKYDLQSQKVKEFKNANGHITKHAYNDKGQLIETIIGFGTVNQQSMSYTYNNFGKVKTVISKGDEKTQDAIVQYNYNENGHLDLIIDPEQNKFEYKDFDQMGNARQFIDPTGQTWYMEYDNAGRIITDINPLGYSISYIYNGVNNLTDIYEGNDSHLNFQYDDHNNLTGITNPDNTTYQMVYNTDNQLIAEIDESGKTIIRNEYDNERRLSKIIDAENNMINIYYDETEESYASSYNPIKIEYPTYTEIYHYNKRQFVVGQTIQSKDLNEQTVYFKHDANGNIIEITDAEEQTLNYRYDSLGQLEKVTDSKGRTMEYFHDARGNLIKTIDPAALEISYTYDRNDRVTNVTKPNNIVKTFEYDDKNRSISIFDTKNQQTKLVMDKVNRLKEMHLYSSDNLTAPSQVFTYTYDRFDNLIEYDDGITKGTYQYDLKNNMTSATIDYGALSLTYQYTYYPDGLKKSFTGPDQITYVYHYNDIGQIKQIEIPDVGIIVFNEYLWTKPTKITLPGGIQRVCEYDSLMRVSKINVLDPCGQQLMQREYSYSPAGNIIQMKTEHGIYNYDYDYLYQLETITLPDMKTKRFKYDEIGNRTYDEIVGESYLYSDYQLTQYGNTHYSYDANGNVTHISGSDSYTDLYLEYNVKNQLISAKSDGDAISVVFYYNPSGQRICKQVNGIKTYYLYAQEGLIGEYDENGQPIRVYGYIPGSTWTYNPIFQKTDKYYWYVNDHMGTPQKMVETNGQTVWEASYDVFGKANIKINKCSNPLRFPGQYYDSEINMHYNWNRFYDPVTGRYIQMDMYNNDINYYVYAQNNPLIFFDETGLCSNEMSEPFLTKKRSKKIKKKIIKNKKIKKIKRIVKVIANVAEDEDDNDYDGDPDREFDTYEDDPEEEILNETLDYLQDMTEGRVDPTEIISKGAELSRRGLEKLSNNNRSIRAANMKKNGFGSYEQDSDLLGLKDLYPTKEDRYNDFRKDYKRRNGSEPGFAVDLLYKFFHGDPEETHGALKDYEYLLPMCQF
jgi:RHS repeat-associated protein